MTSDKTEKKADWIKTPFTNLTRYRPSGKYFARLRVGGKLIVRSLKTNVMSVAKLRLADLEKAERQKIENQGAVASGTMSFGDALELYRKRLAGDGALKPRSKVYREERTAALLKSWPTLKETDVRKITKTDCLNWAAEFSKKSAPSNFNNTVGTLRIVLDIAVEVGARYDNPAKFIKKRRVLAKALRLPTHQEFLDLVKLINTSDGGWNHRCAQLVQFLAFGGFRKGEAAKITWEDCDFTKGEITVRGDDETGTKNWSVRRVPMIPEMRQLLNGLRTERAEEPPNTPVMEIQECTGAINTACKKLGVTRFTHHDLRHLFATRCIESGVDVPTVSRWLGHKDGGALAMKTYGHLRDQHSTNMAQKVSFANPKVDSSAFSMDSVKNMATFAPKLKQPKDPISTFLKSKLSDETLKTLKKYDGGKPHLQSLQIALAQDLNAIIKGELIYTAERFAGVIIAQETKQLMEQNPSGEDLVYLNRMLLEDAYPVEIPRITKTS